MKQKTDKNMLDMVPMKHKRLTWVIKENGCVQLQIQRNSLFRRFVRLFLANPETVTIDLDEYGTAVWQAIDGSQNIHEIGVIISAHFGDKVEPLYERLCKYMAIMKENRFIEFAQDSAKI